VEDGRRMGCHGRLDPLGNSINVVVDVLDGWMDGGG
jgi:hypothetical protein